MPDLTGQAGSFTFREKPELAIERMAGHQLATLISLVFRPPVIGALGIGIALLLGLVVLLGDGPTRRAERLLCAWKGRWPPKRYRG
jgi:hypothetical protein